MFNWWTELFTSGAMGALVALVLAVVGVLLVGNAIIWPLVGLKVLITRKPAEAKVSDPV
jgi:hypothetical protein